MLDIEYRHKLNIGINYLFFFLAFFNPKRFDLEEMMNKYRI